MCLYTCDVLSAVITDVTADSALCPVRCALCPVHCPLCPVPCALCTVCCAGRGLSRRFCTASLDAADPFTELIGGFARGLSDCVVSGLVRILPAELWTAAYAEPPVADRVVRWDD
jgi:hypothetical protein